MSSNRAPDKDPITIVVQSRPARFTLAKDLVLPPATRLQLDECLTRLRYHSVIYHDWGFSEVDPMGRSLVVSLQGPPGTGKTMAAEALAGTLLRPFIHLGIAEVESSLLGATGRNIIAAFEAARKVNAVLFFDEADTLLGKRLSSVTQGVDQEINAMRSTMFIELERFEGIVVFASNFAQNYDKAFLSRISYHVTFGLPEVEELRALWDRMITSKIPLADARATLIERCAVSSVGLAGRDIRTCMRLALPKALLAAGGDPAKAQLAWEHVSEAIAQVRSVASSDGAKPVDPRVESIRGLMNRSIREEGDDHGIS
jgi:AAA+ superfamily predicted ATPase